MVVSRLICALRVWFLLRWYAKSRGLLLVGRYCASPSAAATQLDIRLRALRSSRSVASAILSELTHALFRFSQRTKLLKLPHTGTTYCCNGGGARQVSSPRRTDAQETLAHQPPVSLFWWRVCR